MSMEWKKCRLESISESIQTGPFGSQLHQSDYSEMGTPVIMPKDMVNGTLVESSIARISYDHVQRLKRHQVKAGDIIYSRRGDVGRCVLITKGQEDWICGTGCLKVSLKKNEVIPSFIIYILQRKDSVGWVENHAVGATMPNLNTGILSKLPLLLPSLPIQQKIASILSAYDSLIENNTKRIKLLEQMAENLYKEWFVRFRFPGHENVEMKNGLPKGWKRTKLTKEYKTSSGGTPSRSVPEYYENGNIPWIKTGELQDCILTETEECITEEAVKHSSAKLFPKGTLLMAMYGVNIGKLAISDIEATCNQACCVIVPKRIESKYYLFYYMKSIRDYLLSISFGAAQQNLSQELIKGLKIVIPADDILIAFEQKIKTIYAQMRNFQKQNQLLIKQRDLLLPRLMSGKLEVKP